MAPQGQILSNLGPVFCKKSTPIWIRKMSLFFGRVFPFFGCQNWPFLRGLTKCQNGGANVRMGVQRGIWFTFLIAALYWMIRVSKFNRHSFFTSPSLLQLAPPHRAQRCSNIVIIHYGPEATPTNKKYRKIRK